MLFFYFQFSRFVSQVFRELTEELTGVDDLVSRFKLMGFTAAAELYGGINDLLCPLADGKEEAHAQWTAFFKANSTDFENVIESVFGLSLNLPSLLQVLPCETIFFQMLDRKIALAVKQFSEADNHAQFCK